MVELQVLELVSRVYKIKNKIERENIVGIFPSFQKKKKKENMAGEKRTDPRKGEEKDDNTPFR